MTIDPKKLKEQAQAVATMKEQPAATTTKMEAPPAAAPSAPKPPPLPRVPRSPRRPAVAAREAAAAAPQPPPAARGRELPADPAAREVALAEVRPLAETILALCDVLASRLPPERPLSAEERKAIGGPLELTLYKYGGDLGPEWQLALAVGMVALGRYVEAKGQAKKEPAVEPQKAA